MNLLDSNLRVDAVMSVDDRGQMVLPKEIRQRAGINTGDKLALVSYEREGQICCLWLMKTEQLLGSVRASLGPLMNALAQASDAAGPSGETEGTDSSSVAEPGARP